MFSSYLFPAKVNATSFPLESDILILELVQHDKKLSRFYSDCERSLCFTFKINGKNIVYLAGYHDTELGVFPPGLNFQIEKFTVGRIESSLESINQ